MQKNRAEAVPLELQSTDMERKKEQYIKIQSTSCLNSGVSSKVSKLVAGENIDKFKKFLETEILKVRQEMIIIGSAKGLNDPETVSLSQELDSLLNQFYLLK